MSDYKTVKELFNAHSTLVINGPKIQQIIDYYNRFITMNQEHINFFGGVLIGVNNIKYLPKDSNEWIEDICEFDDFSYIRDEFHKLKGINKEFNVNGNPLNNSFVWLTHRVMTDPKLKHDVKMRAGVAILSMMQAKFITYLNSRSFGQYRASEELADEVYQELSLRNNIKRLSSWKALIEYRSEHYLSPKFPKHKNIIRYNDNVECVEVVTAIYSAVNNHYTTLSRMFYDRANEQKAVQNNSAFETIDGVKSIKDYQSDTSNYLNKVSQVYLSKEEFIKEELVELSLKLVSSAINKNLKLCLETVFEDAQKHPEDKKSIIKITEEFIPYMFNYMRRENLEDNIWEFTRDMRNLIRSSTSKEPEIVALKKYVKHVVKRSLRKVKHDATLGATRTVLALYIILRILTIRNYN